MEFSDFMSFMFEMQEKFPEMRWNVNDCQVSLYLPVPLETSNLLRDAQKMFEPI